MGLETIIIVGGVIIVIAIFVALVKAKAKASKSGPRGKPPGSTTN